MKNWKRQQFIRYGSNVRIIFISCQLVESFFTALILRKKKKIKKEK